MQWVMNKQGQLLMIDSRPFPPLLQGQYCTQTQLSKISCTLPKLLP